MLLQHYNYDAFEVSVSFRLIDSEEFSMRMINVLYLVVSKPKSQAEEKSLFLDKLGCLRPYGHCLMSVFTSFYWDLCFYGIISIDIYVYLDKEYGLL